MLLLAGACGGAGTDVAPAEDPYAGDRRIQRVLQGCKAPFDRYYDRDTSDVLPILVEKLVKGGMDPLRRAKEELGEAGRVAVTPLRRLYDRHSANAFESPYVENVLDAAGLSEAEGMREIILLGLRHAQESVRKRALDALLAGHVRPEDFDVLLTHVEGLEQLQLKQSFAAGLHAADAARAEELYLRWLATGEHRPLWGSLLPLLADSRRSATAEAASALLAELGPEEGAWVAAPAARGGDDSARALLVREARSEDYGKRARAIRAMSAAGLGAELAELLDVEEASELRATVLGGLDMLESWGEEVRPAVAAAMDDPAPQVRSFALRVLVERGDEGATNRALTQLAGSPALLQDGLVALRVPMQEDPALARRALDQLLTRHELESHRPLSQRLASLKGVGQVPLAEAARFLREIGLDHPDVRIESLRAHEWTSIQAANTGREGRAWLRTELPGERDPLRRLDLVWAITAQRDNLARDVLLELVQGAAASPEELLFAADRLVNVGPAATVAPILKRVSYELERDEVRVPLQCLLWRWY